MTNIEKRFWGKVCKSADINKCWHWQGAFNKKGYGSVALGDGRNITPHRLSYIIHYGPISDALDIKRTCRNKSCVNPNHLIAAHKGPPKGIIPWNKGKGIPATERFWHYVQISEEASSCWLWRGYISKDGYGSFTPSHIPIRAHRFMYKLTYGNIPPKTLICHTCDNPPCVNPKHLFIGTNSDNMKDASKKGRLKGKKGTLNPLAKLTEKQVLQIRSLKGLISCRKLADIFNVSNQRISAIMIRKVWTHI